MIIGLSGYARSGKDTVADYLVNNYGFKRVAFADAIRDALLAINPFVPNAYFLKDVVEFEGWDVAKSIPHVRVMMQNFGVHARENWDKNFWVDIVFKQIHKSEDVVITDVRFANEALAIIHSPMQSALVRINRPDVKPINNHQSEVDLDNYSFKHVIDNDSDLFDLHLQVENLMREFNILKK